MDAYRTDELQSWPATEAEDAASMTSGFSLIQSALVGQPIEQPDNAALMERLRVMEAQLQQQNRLVRLQQNRIEVEAAFAGRPNNGLPGRSAVKMQTAARRHLAMQGLRAAVRKATAIQANTRMRLAAWRFAKMLVAASRLQAAARRRAPS